MKRAYCILLSVLFSMFGIVCMTDSKSGFAEEVLAEDVLRRASGCRRGTSLQLTDEDMKAVSRRCAVIVVNK